MAEVEVTPVDVPVAEPVVDAPIETPTEEATEDASTKRKLEDAPVDGEAAEHVAKRAREEEVNGVEVRAPKISREVPLAYGYISSETTYNT